MCAIWLAAVDGSSPPAKLTAITLTASLTGQAERFLPELVTKESGQARLARTP